jgi:hypothetical protein
MKGHFMLFRVCLLVIVVSSLGRADGQAASGNTAQPVTDAQAARVDQSVRSFMAGIARDVTREGPVAWRKHFADSPVFFMVNDGQMAFAHSTDATKGIHDFATKIRSIHLEWGSDLRVDPLTQGFAVVAASFSEEQNFLDGRSVQERGYFTGVAQMRDGRWQLRDAHWSSVRGQ